MFSSATGVVIGVAGLIFAVPAIQTLRVFLRFRGNRVVPCPETATPAAVVLDSAHAAWRGLTGKPELVIQQCSRWPERAACGQECLRRISESPQDCLVRTILARFYVGQKCAICARPIPRINWMERNPALLGPDGRTICWNDIQSQHLYAILETHRPACFGCHVAETFRREHPDLVTDRNWR